MNNAVRYVVASLVVVWGVSAFAWNVWGTDSLPGTPALRHELNVLRAAEGCDEYSSTAGQSNCAVSDPGCETTPGGYCAINGTKQEGASCGGCTGLKHQVCIASSYNSNDLCELWQDDCCNHIGKCKNGAVICYCSKSTPGGRDGYRIIAHITSNAQQCIDEDGS